MNSLETGCLGVAAALALSALAGDAAADDAAVSHASAPTAARPPSARATQAKARPRARVEAATRPDLARSAGAPTTFDAASSLMPPLLTPVVPVVSVPAAALLPGAEPSDAELREKHLREAPQVPTPGAPPVRTTSDEPSSEHATGDEHALEVAERLLGDGVPLQLLETVIVPAARGVTIAEIQTEGAAAVSLSVRPTKITRGSGLVAVGRF